MFSIAVAKSLTWIAAKNKHSTHIHFRDFESPWPGAILSLLCLYQRTRDWLECCIKLARKSNFTEIWVINKTQRNRDKIAKKENAVAILELLSQQFPICRRLRKRRIKRERKFRVVCSFLHTSHMCRDLNPNHMFNSDSVEAAKKLNRLHMSFELTYVPNSSLTDCLVT